MSLSFQVEFVRFLETIIETSDFLFRLVLNALFRERQIAAESAPVHHLQKELVLNHAHCSILDSAVVVHHMLVFVAEEFEGDVPLGGRDRHLSWCF